MIKKVYIAMLDYNMELTIGPAIASTYDYVDEIIVVDGSADGPSTDRTAERAQSFGKKITYISGTFTAEDGSWDEIKQRQVSLALAEKDFNNWMNLQDADEVYDKEKFIRFIEYLQAAKTITKVFSVSSISFWRDINHCITGGQWSAPRACSAWRLIPQIQQLAYNVIGTIKDNGFRDNWRTLYEHKRVPIPSNEVFFYHYGHVLSYERAAFKQRYMVEQGWYAKVGYEKTDWKRYEIEEFIPLWNKKTNIPGCVEFTGKHPATMLPVLDNLKDIWKEKK